MASSSSNTKTYHPHMTPASSSYQYSESSGLSWTQPIGCTIVVNESSFRVIAYSENTCNMLAFMPLTIGTDVRTLFTPSGSGLLEKAFKFAMLSPIRLQSRCSTRPFHAIMHRIRINGEGGGGVVIDLEPARTDEDPALISTQTHKMAVRAMSLLQSLPGDIKLLCDTVVDCVRELTGYDRVMLYRFHDDYHGEVVAESKRDDLEPYVGMHYPATDIPQDLRLFFKQNMVTMVVDCHVDPVRVIQDGTLFQSPCLIRSSLKAPHSCHTQYMSNMSSIASLTMAVIIEGNDDHNAFSTAERHSTNKLWGLVMCHHTLPFYTNFALRCACDFLMQAFRKQLNMELQLALQQAEKHVSKTQALLCDMMLRDSPTGIVMQSPNIMDLVKCDGAALYYNQGYYPLGVSPTESQIKDIVDWLYDKHGDSTGLSTDSLTAIGYPGATSLGDAVYGMAVACITTEEILFWFRSNTGIKTKSGGEANHHPEENNDGKRMHPTSSCTDFSKVSKGRSLPWEHAEMDAIHSLQLIVRESFRGVEGSGSDGVDEPRSVAITKEISHSIIQSTMVPIIAVDADGLVSGWNGKVAELSDKFIQIQGDYNGIVHSLSPLIPPIFTSDKNARCSEWNTSMEKLTGWSKTEVLEKMLVNEIFGSMCMLKDSDVMTKFTIVLQKSIEVYGTYTIPFALFDRRGKYVETVLTTNTRVNMNGQIIGAFCFLQILAPFVQRSPRASAKQVEEDKCVLKRYDQMSLICQEMKKPLNGIRFANSLLEATGLTEEQRRILKTSVSCEKQMLKIVNDVTRRNIATGPSVLEMVEFTLESLIDAVIIQVAPLFAERASLQLDFTLPEEGKKLVVKGDRDRIQQVLVNFLGSTTRYAPFQNNCHVEIQVKPVIKKGHGGTTAVHVEFRIVCPGVGLPEALVRHMLNGGGVVTSESMGLSMCRKTINLMEGRVDYVREAGRCYFFVALDLPLPVM